VFSLAAAQLDSLRDEENSKMFRFSDFSWHFFKKIKKVEGNEHAHKILYAGTTDPEFKTYLANDWIIFGTQLKSY